MIEIEGYESVEKYANRIHYSISTVRKLIKNKALKSKKIKGRVYVKWIE
jgi:hypothetical protein